jgi:hypothetical protein
MAITLSETKTFLIDCNCSKQDIVLVWLNNLGGFEYWKFTAQKDYGVEIGETGQVKKNIFPEWPKSYGTNADTIRKQTFRDTNNFMTVRSQYVTLDQIKALSYIKSSVLVQIQTSRQDRRTVLVDTDSFVTYPDGADLYSIAFNISFTDDISSQTA